MNVPARPASDAQLNHLIAALPAAEWLRWEPHLERVSMRQGDVLFEPGEAPAFVTFPTTAIVSLLYITRDGASAEVAVVGNDGVVGLALFMGGDATLNHAVVQSAGEGYRMRAQMATNEMYRAGPFPGTLLRYTQALIAQLAQTAVCNRHHSIEQQLCRRLLQGLDRLRSAELAMTHESLARLLGVRREGVTAAASRLQQDGVIRYQRGRIDVLDRAELEQRACECYSMARKECQRLLPAPVPA